MVNPEETIEKIKTVGELLDFLEEDLLNCNTRSERQEVFNTYHNLLIHQYAEDDCPEMAKNLIISPLKKELWERYEDDLFRAENYLNKIGVETRYGKGMDRFRPMRKICDDIAKVYGCSIERQE